MKKLAKLSLLAAEGMTSLANVIKSVTEEKNVKVISLRSVVRPVKKQAEPSADVNRKKLEQVERELIRKAEIKANELMKQAEEKARQKAEALKKREEALQEKISHALEEARAKGYDEGFQIGRKDGMQSVQELMNEAREMVDLTHQEYVKKLAEAEPMIIKFAIALAEKIVGHHLETQPELWSHLVKSAIKEVKEHENIKIFVHPKKYEWILSSKRMLKAAVNDTTEIYIYPNEELAEDACIIETSFGKIDASVDTQLMEMKKHLLEIVEEKQNA